MRRSNLLIIFYIFALMTMISWVSLVVGVSFEELEMRNLWGILSGARGGDSFYRDILTHAPMGYLNVTGLLLRVSGIYSYLGPHLIVLALFLFCLFINLESLNSEKKPLLMRLIVFSVFLAHPSVIWMLSQRSVEVFTLTGLFAYTSGLIDSNRGNHGRGLLLMAMSSFLLCLSGNLGIAILIALLIGSPVYLRSDMFRESALGGYTILSFPALATLTGLSYLSWLYSVPMIDLLFHYQNQDARLQQLIHWTPFLILVLPYVPKALRLGRADFFMKQKPILFVFAASQILLLIGRGSKEEVVLAFGTLGMSFEFLNKNHVRLKHLGLSVLFVGAAWLFQLKFPLERIDQLLPLLGEALISPLTPRGDMADLFRGYLLLFLLISLRLYYLHEDAQKEENNVR